MNELIPFDYQGKQVRTVMISGQPWFVAKDVAAVLDIQDPRTIVDRLDEDECGKTTVIDSLGREQEVHIISESGIYEAISRSNKDEAKPFQRWVRKEVLPSIRKTGGYMVIPKTLPEALRAYADEVETRLLAEAKIKELQPKADFFDAVADSKSAIDMAVAAKVLALPGVGRNKLFEELRRHRVLDQYNRPFQEYVDRGYFRVIEQKYTKPDGSTHINIKTLVYQKGLDYIRRVLTIKKAG